jgi:ribonuclease E
MLFNATQAEELRVAIVDGQKLIDLDIESAGKEQRKSNIYKGVITRIEPSLEACFVDYGAERHGFLPFKDIPRQTQGRDEGRVSDSLREGQELIVQVDKDGRGNKGAALNGYISLAGRYLVLKPNNPKSGGVSRRIEGDDRSELRDQLNKLDLPSGMSAIARTAGIGRTVEELQWDLNYLMQLWSAIEDAARSQKAPFLIYQESSLVIRAIRDYYKPEIGEILVDTKEIYDQAQQFMQHVMPNDVQRVKLYHDDVPLFSRFQIEHQIETAYGRTVALPSGGAIVIDHTEALVAIDVNSARSTRGSDIETTAFETNLEAVEEVARQLRLRDLGGLIVIDFIDMESQKNQRLVEERLHEALRYDRARVQISKISRFGLLELSRQRLRPALAETSHISCPRCHGIGHIRGTESTALHILRIIQEEAMKENTAQIVAQVPIDVATYLLNEKRNDVLMVEARCKVNVLLVPNRHYDTPNFSIERLRIDELAADAPLPSFERIDLPEETDVIREKKEKEEAKDARQEAKVKGITHEARPVEPKKSLFARFMAWLNTPAETPAKPSTSSEKTSDKSRRAREDDRGDRRQKTRGDKNDRNERGERNADRAERNNDRNGERGESNGRGNARGERKSTPRDEPSLSTDNKRDNHRGNRRASNENEETPKNTRGERGDRAERPERSERSASDNARGNERNGEKNERNAERSERRSRRGDPLPQTTENAAPEEVAPTGTRGNKQRQPRRAKNEDLLTEALPVAAVPAVESEVSEASAAPALPSGDVNLSHLAFVVDKTPAEVAEVKEPRAEESGESLLYSEDRRRSNRRGIHGRRMGRNRKSEDRAGHHGHAAGETSSELPELDAEEMPTLTFVDTNIDRVLPPDTFSSSSSATLNRPAHEGHAHPPHADAGAKITAGAPNLDAFIKHQAAVVLQPETMPEKPLKPDLPKALASEKAIAVSVAHAVSELPERASSTDFHVSLTPDLSSAGLHMVETRASAAGIETVSEAPRVKRERPPRQVVEEAPLKLVETKK